MARRVDAIEMVMGELPRIDRLPGALPPARPRAASHADAAEECVGLVALDLDGTLLSPDGHVTPRTKQAIRRLIESGVNVCIATGRSWWESRHVVAEGELEGPGVFVGGAIVNDMANGHSLAHTRMRPAVARAVCHELEQSDVASLVMQDRHHADVEWLISAEREMPPTLPEWLAHHGSSYRRVEGLRSAAHEWTVRVGTVTRSADHCATIATRLSAALGQGVYLHQITVPINGVSVLEVFDASVNKWSGIRQVAAHLNVDDRAVIAIGDDMNDLHMLRHARWGVAMGNARPEVKAAADQVIGANAEEGLARFLETLSDTGGRLPIAPTGSDG